MNPLPVQRAGSLCLQGPQTQWLIDDLWTDQAVGILGGEPKCCKSFLALDIALSVAAGCDCLRRYRVRRQGPVLLFPAEDSLPIVRQRLEGIAAAADQDLQAIPLDVITAPTLRLDLAADRARLENTLEVLRPVLLVLDPLIRLHRVDENDATQIAALLSFLRQMQRRFELAVLIVHHARKDSRSSRPGQALRGSSELHGWGDSNLYMRRRKNQLSLSTEHRAAAGVDHIPLHLIEQDQALCLRILDTDTDADSSLQPDPTPTPQQRVQDALAQQHGSISLQSLRRLCAMRTATLCQALNQLQQSGLVTHDQRGYRMASQPPPQPPSQSAVSLSRPIDPSGNGNGKQPSSPSP